MIAMLLMAAEPMTAIDAAPAPSAIDAERAFAADAQKLGQWTAFRKYAADDALMFLPQPTNAQAFLKDRKDPPTAVFWWPGRSYVSCDGSYAVNTGPWVREWGKAVGYFTTVWKRQPDGGWKWIYDGGDALKAARSEGGDISPVVASCTGKPYMMPHSQGSADWSLAWTNAVGPDGQRAFSFGCGAAKITKCDRPLFPAPPNDRAVHPGFLPLLGNIDPAGCPPIFASLTRGTAAPQGGGMAFPSAGAPGKIEFLPLAGEPLLGNFEFPWTPSPPPGVIVFLNPRELGSTPPHPPGNPKKNRGPPSQNPLSQASQEPARYSLIFLNRRKNIRFIPPKRIFTCFCGGLINPP